MVPVNICLSPLGVRFSPDMTGQMPPAGKNPSKFRHRGCFYNLFRHLLCRIFIRFKNFKEKRKKDLHFLRSHAIMIKLSARDAQQRQAPLAQLDRASGYGPEGRGFESLTAYHVTAKLALRSRFFCLKAVRFAGGFFGTLPICRTYTGTSIPERRQTGACSG